MSADKFDDLLAVCAVADAGTDYDLLEGAKIDLQVFFEAKHRHLMRVYLDQLPYAARDLCRMAVGRRIK